MKPTFKKNLCLALMFAIMFMSFTAFSMRNVSAKELISNGLILSTDSIVVAKGTVETFTASLCEGYDASRLICIVADPNVASVTPIAYAGNVAAFQVDYIRGGQTVAAVTHMDNPDVIAYVPINAPEIIMEIPAILGTNHDNYCKLTSYEFVPYDFTYTDFHDYKSTLNIKYQCVAYNDKDYSKWGCYGYFYDAEGNVLSKVHLYCGILQKNKIYHSEFNVPVNAVRFSIEGF